MKNYSHSILGVEPILEIMKAIWGFIRVSARAINKVKGK
ncbi:hypothetical protein ACUXFI_001271 [Staphylococcus epidermidis]